MGLSKKWLASPSQLVLEVDVLDKKVNAAVHRAMYKTAEFGVTAVQRTIAQTLPRPVATNTYRLSWTAKRTRKGAIMGTNALHGYFVEVGRRPGRMPPVAAIEEWLKIKRIVPPMFAAAESARKARRKGGKQKRGAGGRFVATRKSAAERLAAAQTSFAYIIARKIAREGTPGRYVLARTMPVIGKYAAKQTRKEIARIL